jgi:hypothetical protein
MVRRIDIGRVLGGVGAILVVVSLFLDWFEGDLTGWTAFEALDLVLAALALVALAAVTRLYIGGRVSERHLPLAGGVMAVIVVAALINHPPAAAERSPDLGAWLALGGAALVIVGGLLCAAHVALSISTSDSVTARPEAEETTQVAEDARIWNRSSEPGG